MEIDRATIFVEGRPYEVASGQSLLRACLSLGFNVPYFCWHPAFESIGACRQCAVKVFRDEEDKRGRIVMSCMTSVSEGMRVSIEDEGARKFRAGVIEWLMLNHPHDCPVCDEGGECHLQDMTVMTGHTYRRTRFRKRTYRNQYLGPFINHEMNRCIQCYRCVRFYCDYAGGRDFGVFAANNHVYFGRHEDGVLENAFSGNLVEVCPTGVFTDKTFKHHYTRKWDLQTAPSICIHCGLGCNTIPGERYGLLRRIRNRYNSKVNGYFLCDRGRFGYEFVNHGRRIRQASFKAGESDLRKEVAGEEALQYILQAMSGAGNVVGIGSPRASLEANFALRALVGPKRFYAGVSGMELRLITKARNILEKGPGRTPSLGEVAGCDAVFVLGEDVPNTAPMLALSIIQALRNGPMAIAKGLHIPLLDDRAVREAIQYEKGPCFVATSEDTWLDSLAAGVYRGAPEDVARLGFAVAHQLDPVAPAVSDLNAETAELAAMIAARLKEAARPLVISGISYRNEKVLEAASDVVGALRNTVGKGEICLVMPECNGLGLVLMADQGLEEAFAAVEDGEAYTVIILENDLYRRMEEAQVDAFFDKCRHVIAIDHLLNATALRADVLLPAATFAESSGTLINNEGRGQRFFQVFVSEGEVEASWRWLRDVMKKMGHPEGGDWMNLDDVVADMALSIPVLSKVPDIAPSVDLRIEGQKIPRQPHRYSGRTSMHADLDVHEPKPPDDSDSPLVFSMEGYDGPLLPSLNSHFWTPGWNSVQAVNKFQDGVGGPLRGGDPGIRLIEPGEAATYTYFGDAPGAVGGCRGDVDFIVIPLHHIFGSEELSCLSPGIAERIPGSYIALNQKDAVRLGMSEGEEAEVEFSGHIYRAPVQIRSQLPLGVAGVPAGFAAFRGFTLAGRARIRKATQ